MTTYLEPLAQMDLPDYDTRRSIENLLRDFLPKIFLLVRDDTSSEFGTRFVRTTNDFVRRFFTILLTCTGRDNSENYLNQLLQSTLPLHQCKYILNIF